MTDKEIRDELAGKIEAEKRRVYVDVPIGPPLMIIASMRLKPEDAFRIRQVLYDSLNREGPGNLVVIDSGMDIFQMIDGEWRQIKPEDR